MRLKLCVLFCLFNVFLLCGCEFEFMSPDNLVTAPASNQEKLQQKQLITSFLGRDEHLIVPKGMDNTNAYQYIDLDGDGQDEIVAFYANKENNFMLGFVILDQTEDQWFLSRKVIAYGTDIHFFSARDLDGDGNMELMLGVRTGYGSLNELYLYQLNQSEIVEVTDEDRITYDQLTVAQKADGHDVIVTACMDTSVLEGSSNIVVYAYRGGEVSTVYNETFNGYCSEIHFAQISRDQQGIYLAMRHNHFVNILLLKETEESFAMLMEHPLPYDYEEMQDVTLFNDENGDGILEINLLWEPERELPGKTYKDYIQVWLQWDGANGLYAVDAVLENSVDGYHFQLPLEWIDALYYEFRNENDISWIDFYCENEALEFEAVFSFAAIDQLVWQNMQQSDSLVVLGNNPNKNKVYVAEIQKEEFDGFEVTASRLISCLQIEGK